MKTSPQKTIGEFGFEHEPPVILAWPCNKPFSAQKKKRKKKKKERRPIIVGGGEVGETRLRDPEPSAHLSAIDRVDSK